MIERRGFLATLLAALLAPAVKLKARLLPPPDPGPVLGYVSAHIKRSGGAWGFYERPFYEADLPALFRDGDMAQGIIEYDALATFLDGHPSPGIDRRPHPVLADDLMDDLVVVEGDQPVGEWRTLRIPDDSPPIAWAPGEGIGDREHVGPGVTFADGFESGPTIRW